ncbi:MAG: tail fiber domain-containing protein, partial [Candidatus Yanofskybacteria bacterium]|nr:tail fiber domain-containing protein [Candidatus Yanofskybacteria bacterium]
IASTSSNYTWDFLDTQVSFAGGRIMPNGNVGIGTTAPGTKLEMVNSENTSTDYDIKFIKIGASINSTNVVWSALGMYDDNGSIYGADIGFSTPVGGGYSLTFGTNNDIVGNPITRMTINNFGNIGMGTTTPAMKLHVASTSDEAVLRLQDSDGTCDYNPESTDTGFSCSSDARLKTNIREASPALPYLLGLPIKDYVVISSQEEKTGVVAQDLLEKYSELVSLGDDGFYKVTPVTSWKVVKGIQELDAKIASLSAQLNNNGVIVDSGSSGGSVTINNRLSVDDILGVYASGSAVALEHSSEFDSLKLKAVKNLIFDAPVSIFQSIWAKGDFITDGIKKTYYTVANILPNVDIATMAANWVSRDVIISNDADLDTLSLFSGNGAQAAEQSKADLAENGNYIATYGVDSTRGEVQLSGSSDLVGGEAKIYFDYSFTALISDVASIKVIVTPTTNTIRGQLYVANKTPYGFTIRELNGLSDGKFDWLVIARRKGYEGADGQNTNSQTQTTNEPTPFPIPIPEPSLSENPTPSTEPSINLESSVSPIPTPEILLTPEPILSESPSHTPLEPTPEPPANSGVTGQVPTLSSGPTPESSVETILSPTPTPTDALTP